MNNNLINPVAEGVVLGAILAQPEAIVELDNITRPDDFAVPMHQWIAAAAWECLADKTPPTLAAVIGKLQAAGRWADRVSKSAACMEDLDVLVSAVSDGDVAYVKHNAAQVATLALRRNGQREMTRLAKMFEDGELAPEELQSAANRQIGAVFAGRAGRDGSIKRVGQNERERRQKGNQVGVTCGIKWLDSATGGFLPGETWVIGGVYKGRKTTLALNMVLAATRAGTPASILTVGDSSIQSTYRMMTAIELNRLALVKGQGTLPVASARILINELNHPQLAALRQEAEANIEALPIYMYDGRDRVGYLSEAERILRRDRAMHGIGIFVYDFAQALWEGRGDYEKQVLISPWLQQMAGELEMTAVCLSQLSEETIKHGSQGNSPGAKGGGALPAAANVFLVTSYQEPTLRVQLKLARNSGSTPQPIDHLISPPSGLILDADK